MRRWIVLVAVQAAIVTVVLPLPQAGAAGGNNVVLVFNTTDLRSAARSNLLVTIAAAGENESSNLAVARASCTDCRTVAVAMQAVLITRDADVISPRNAATAINADCVRCTTLAFAYQYVLTTQHPVVLSAEARRAIGGLRGRLGEIAASDLDPFTMEERLQTVYAEFASLVRDRAAVAAVAVVAEETRRDAKAAAA